MKQLVKATAILAGMMAFSGIAFAQCKIVVVDMQDAVIKSNEGVAQNAKFDAKTAEWVAKLDKKKADIDALNTKYKQQQALGTASALAELKRQIDTATTDLNRMTEDAQKEVDDYRDQLLSPIMMTAQATLDALANEKNYSIVYDLSAPNSPIVYSSKECDITNEIKTRMNAKTAAAGTTTPATGGRGATSPATTTPATGRGGAATGTTTTPPRGGTTPATTTPAAGSRGTTPAPPATPPATPPK